ncbi:unnamed protein product [Blepharisma stoltei]|uniref:Receptor ligand binding region domain-containing protein n=1 Tax=Blepharisma stoltei TaxID=1481888 RepID=A0AAU9IVG3_9CILI|nr:unnamed protein product [Blepharisma stoltei]
MPCVRFTSMMVLFASISRIFTLEIIITCPDLEETNSVSKTKFFDRKSLFEAIRIIDPPIEFHECKPSRIVECITSHQNSSILLDLSFDLNTQLALSQFSQENSLVHLIYHKHIKYSDKWTFSITTSMNDQMKAFFKLLSYFNWTEGIVFGNTANYAIKDEILRFSNELKFIYIESGTNIDELVNKVVFNLGSTLYYIFTDPIESANLQNSLRNSRLLDSGNGILLTQDSGYGSNLLGALIITDFGHEFDKNPNEHFIKCVTHTLTYISNNISSENPEEIVQLIELYLPNHYSKNEFSIVNIQNGNRIIVGSIVNEVVTIFSNISFPGLTYSVPKSTKKILPLSINGGTTNPGGPSVPNQKLGAIGSYVAMDKINEGSDILSNFQLSLHDYDCGVSIFNEAFARACYTKDIENLGLAHFTAYGSAVALGALQIFSQLNITIPNIGSVNSNPTLSSSTEYPAYVRLLSSAIYSQSLILLKAMGWTKAAILYENNGWGFPVYTQMLATAKTLGIEFVNPEDLRPLATGLNSTTISSYKASFQAVVDSQVRLFIILIQPPSCNSAAEYLYDLGIRKGDLVIMAAVPDTLSYFLMNDTNLYKRLEAGYTTLTVSNLMFVGDIGQDAIKRIASSYHMAATTFNCYYFDALLLTAYGLDYMINRGQDYSNSTKLMTVIRGVQFNGCTGRVIIDNGSNDRVFDAYLVQAIDVNENGISSIYDIGELKPFSTTLLSIQSPLVYADGTTVKPADYRNENDKCPFPNKEVRTFDKGRAVLFAICFTVGLVTAIITFIIWKKWWNISIEELKEKKEISLQDIIVGATIAIEFFQFSSMGPDYSFMSSFLYDLSNAMSLSLGSILKLENGVFWIVVDGVYAGIVSWIILCAVVLFRLDEKWQNIWIFRLLGTAADYLMPILGNLCFIPFISICLDIFVCDQSIGNNFTDSFLAKDCYYYCWKGEHLVYAILAFIALVAYEPLAVFCRPLWQELQSALHVKAVPLFLMVKTVVQTTLIVLNKTVKRSTDIGHGIVFIIIMTIYVIFIFRFKPYNYARYSWWQGLTLIGVIWLALLSTIELGLRDHTIATPLLTVLIFGWAIIVLVGIYVQRKRYPSLLFKEKARDTSQLFKFAFTFGKQSQSTLSHLKLAQKSSKTLPFEKQ